VTENIDLHGISTGPVVAGIIGSKKFIYDLWIPDIASRMEQLSRFGAIQVSNPPTSGSRTATPLTPRQIEVKAREK
jgi:class 3 adenylate cyclase